MVTAKDISDFVSSSAYKEMLARISTIIDIETQHDYDEIFAEIMSKEIQLAKTELTEIKSTLSEEECVIRYTIRKYNATHGMDDDTGLPDNADSTTTIGYSKDYLLNNLVEITMSKKGKKHLENYFRSIRIAGSKKYATQVLEWVNHD